jgi:hypothetical protein
VASSKVRRKRRVLLSQGFEIDAVERIESPVADPVLLAWQPLPWHIGATVNRQPWLDADATTCARHPDMGGF